MNTVCGTACRLSQCLSQVAMESADGSGGWQPAREAAEAWEGIVRAVGVASAAVKTQMMVLLQEFQSRHNDTSTPSRKQDVAKVIDESNSLNYMVLFLLYKKAMNVLIASMAWFSDCT